MDECVTVWIIVLVVIGFAAGVIVTNELLFNQLTVPDAKCINITRYKETGEFINSNGTMMPVMKPICDYGEITVIRDCHKFTCK